MTSPGAPHGNTPTAPGTGAPPYTLAADGAPPRGPFVLPPPTDRYEIGEEIARGGMGAVHRARDRNLDRELAHLAAMLLNPARLRYVVRDIEARVADVARDLESLLGDRFEKTVRAADHRLRALAP